MNLIELISQNYSETFDSMSRIVLVICMNDSFKDLSRRHTYNGDFFKARYSDQQYMKRYSFIRSYLNDSACEGSEGSYERNAYACCMQNQKYKVHDSAKSNAFVSDYFPFSRSASCTPEDSSFLIDGKNLGLASRASKIYSTGYSSRGQLY